MFLINIGRVPRPPVMTLQEIKHDLFLLSTKHLNPSWISVAVVEARSKYQEVNPGRCVLKNEPLTPTFFARLVKN